MRKFRLLTALAVTAATMFASPSRADAQQRRITGQVTATGTNEPLTAASITVVGTALGTYTNEDGRFNLAAPAGPVQLLVRRIGYQRKTVDVGADQSEVTVQLERDVLQLEKQVITGAATSVAGVNAANDVAVVTAEQLNKAPTPTIENALQGKIAGAQINQNSGAPGGGLQIRLRGVTSIYGASDPLYVVDGVIVSNDVVFSGVNAVSAASSSDGLNASDQDNSVNRIADLNPADIETIEVLKGASASAIYGAKASNGVIVITTKQGRAGRTEFNVTQRLGTFGLANKMDSRKFTLAEAYAYNDDNQQLDSAVVLENFQSCGGDPNNASSRAFCDYEQQVFGEKKMAYETSLSVRGGNANTKFFASGLIKRDPGIMLNTDYRKQGLRLNLQQLVGSRLTLQLNTNLAHSLTARGLSNNDNVNATPYFVFGQVPSYLDFRKKDGLYPYFDFVGSNPIQTAALLQTPEEIYRAIGSVSGTYNLMARERQTLAVNLQAGIDQFFQRDAIFSPRELYFEPNDGFPGTNTAQNAVNVNANWTLGATHTFIAPSRAFTATTSAGMQREYKGLKSNNTVGQDCASGLKNVDACANIVNFARHEEIRDLAFYGQEEFLTLGERLLLTLGARAQRSTVNGDINKFYVFPKSSVSYRFAPFADFLNEFKVRAAIGQSGNEPTFRMKYTPLINGVYQGSPSIRAGFVQGDPNIKPEIQTEVEGGVDVTGFDSRANLAVTLYQKSVSDLILRPVPAPSSGFTQRYVNGGSLRNRGTEIALAVTPVQTDATTWVSRATFSRNVGVVTDLPSFLPSIGFTIPGSFGYGNYHIQEGRSPTQITGPDTTDAPCRDPQGIDCDIKYGDTAPDFNMGFANEITWKGFRLYGLVDWQHGGDIINITQNVYDSFLISPDQTDANPIPKRLHYYDDLNSAEFYVQDGSFVKLREVTVSYEIPAQWTTRLFGSYARAVRAELSGRNLLTWTDYKGVDPEVSNFGNQNIIRNADLAPYPPTRSFFFSLSADF